MDAVALRGLTGSGCQETCSLWLGEGGKDSAGLTCENPQGEGQWEPCLPGSPVLEASLGEHRALGATSRSTVVPVLRI